MARIAGLLSGSDLGRLFDAEREQHADRLAQANRWCQTQPDHVSIQWLAETLGVRRGPRRGAPGTRADSR